MRSANPALNKDTFKQLSTTRYTTNAESMSIQGTVNKTGFMLILILLSASYSWTHPQYFPIFLPVGIIGGLVFAMITIFKKTWAPVTGPVYALLEGLFLGCISMYFERAYPGIVMNAVMLTFGTLGALLLAYKSSLIKATENFKLGVAAATGGVFFLYLSSFILGFFGVNMTFLHDSSLLSIGISFVIVIIAALNLVLDFDFIEQGAKQGAPRYLEWYASFGLMVTLIWLYVEILHLLSKLQRR
ncbi:MAG: Bax inhibitor-1/YccA family membrane protein [Fibrobacterota bacterium]